MEPTLQLLVVDDEPAVLDLFQHVFASQGYEVLSVSTGQAAMDLLSRTRPAVAVVDLVLPDGPGLVLAQQMLQTDPQLPIVMVTASNSSSTAIAAMKLGMFDYLTKPLNVGEIKQVVARAIEVRRLARECAGVRVEDLSDANAEWMIGRSPGMQSVYKAIGRVASRNVTVLIRGESGTGKELVARALFQFGNRSSGPFMAINCAAIPESLLESELFGHEKGAFTGADRQRIGRFEQCNSGTLFLDEVGDMSPTLQSKLLRVLQQQQFERIGGNQTIQTDVRLIAATNRDLERMVADGLFRSDLYYRLNGFSIELPPLRDRVEDLEPLIDHFRHLANQDLGKEVLRFSEPAIQRLRHYHWPGNVRQLQSVVRQAVLQTTGPVVLPDFLPSLPTNRPASGPSSPLVRAVETDELLELIETKVNEGETNLYERVIDEAEKLLLTRVLRMTGGNQVEAAKILGITRTTLRSKILKLGITISQTVGNAEVALER